MENDQNDPQAGGMPGGLDFGQSPFGRLLDLPGIDGPQDIFGSLQPPGGDSPFAGGGDGSASGNPFAGGFGGGMGGSGGGNPFAGGAGGGMGGGNPFAGGGGMGGGMGGGNPFAGGGMGGSGGGNPFAGGDGMGGGGGGNPFAGGAGGDNPFAGGGNPFGGGMPGGGEDQPDGQDNDQYAYDFSAFDQDGQGGRYVYDFSAFDDDKPDMGDGQKPDMGGDQKPDAGEGDKPDMGGDQKPDAGEGDKPDVGDQKPDAEPGKDGDGVSVAVVGQPAPGEGMVAVTGGSDADGKGDEPDQGKPDQGQGDYDFGGLEPDQFIYAEAGDRVVVEGGNNKFVVEVNGQAEDGQGSTVIVEGGNNQFVVIFNYDDDYDGKGQAMDGDQGITFGEPYPGMPGTPMTDEDVGPLPGLAGGIMEAGADNPLLDDPNYVGGDAYVGPDPMGPDPLFDLG